MTIKNKRHIVMGLAAIFSIVFLIATYGTALPAAPFAPVQIDNPVAADSNENFTVVADTDMRRALIINTDGDLTGVIDCTTFDTPIEAISDVCVSGNTIYVAGEMFAGDSPAVERERVVAYDKGGNLLKTVYEKEAGKYGLASLRGLAPTDDGIVVMQQEWDDGGAYFMVNATVTFHFVNLDENHKTKQDTLNSADLFDVAYSAQSGDSSSLSIRGLIDDGASETPRSFSDSVFTAIDMDEAGVMYACDDASGAICKITDDGSVMELYAGSGYQDVHVNGDNVCFTDYENNTVYIGDRAGNLKASYSAITPSIGFSLRMLAVWICAIYLAVLIIVYMVRRTRKAIETGQTQGIAGMLVSISVVIAVGAAAATLSYATYQESVEQRTSVISMCADYLMLESSMISDDLEKCNDRDAIRESGEKADEAVENLNAATEQASSLLSAAKYNNIGLYYIMYGKDDQGYFYLFDSTEEHVFGTSVQESLSEGVIGDAFRGADPDGDLHEGHALRDSTRYRLVSIPSSDGKSIVGVIEIGNRVRSLDSLLAAHLAQRLFALMIIMLVVYLTYSELRACGKCLLVYRKLQERNARDAVAALTRPFTLCITLLSSTDAVMTVLIARDLLEKAGMDQSSLLLALPAIMLGLGLIIGQMLYGALGSRVKLRRLMVTGAFAMLLCALLAVGAVTSGNFWLYCAAKLILSIPFGLLYSLGYSLPRTAEDDEARAAAGAGVKRTDTSAAALGTVLGAYAAQTLGNAWVYVIMAIACIPVILMAFNLLSKDSAPPEPRIAKSKAGPGKLAHFAKSRPALSIALLIVLPATIAAGYASFLFPLFSADLGLQKTEINNIVVIGQLVVYVCINTIEGLEARNGKWRVSTTALALIGVVFLLFSINTTLVWSILVIALVGVLGKTADGWKAMWLTSASEAGVPAGQATGAMFATRSFALLVQPFILGGLLGAADSVAVIVIGAFCVLCAALFYLLTRHLPIARAK